MTDADHVFILVLNDSEIDIVRRAAIMLGKTVTNIVHDFVMEEAERTIEDGEMCSRMARQERRMPCGRDVRTGHTSCDILYLQSRPDTGCKSWIPISPSV